MAVLLLAEVNDGELALDATAKAVTAADYGVDVTPRLEIVKTSEPEARQAGVKVGSVEELISKLKDEAGVI